MYVVTNMSVSCSLMLSAPQQLSSPEPQPASCLLNENHAPENKVDYRPLSENDIQPEKSVSN